MTNERDIVLKTERLIDDLKSICSLNGIGNSPSEYKVITQIFLYKYLNDKFIHEVNKLKFSGKATIKEVEEFLNKIEPIDYSKLDIQLDPNVARIRKEYMISYLFNNQSTTRPEFYELFDSALVGIANDNINIFSVKTESKEKIKLFEALSQNITESSKKNTFFKAIINKLVGFSFESAFEEKYDFFATIFEYLIKDYNKDFGKYAEYYTPNSIARIIARILVPEKDKNVIVYDPAAGSGTLLLALAHQIGERNCTIYSQDISQKSNEFLRLNLILNNLVHSLGNVIHGDTLLEPAHLNEDKTRLKQFDYIVSNPPFKTDFSETRDLLASEKHKERFFAGVPKIKENDKDKMAIYLLFIQHILFSLKDTGKAAIVVPSGFLTAKNGIEKELRKKIVDEHWLRGVVSMPSNIFATTGTSVSVLFIDKSVDNSEVILMDASKLGEKVKEGKNQRTILSSDDMNYIIESFNNKEVIEDFISIASIDRIVKKNYSLNVGQYDEVKIEIDNITKEEFEARLKSYEEKILCLFEKNKELNEIIKNDMETIHNAIR